jgi:hypothetical protein
MLRALALIALAPLVLAMGAVWGAEMELRALSLADAVAAARPFTVSGVATVLGLAPARATARQGRWFRYATIDDRQALTPFGRVEVRERLAPTPGRDGLVILTLRDGPCIDRQAVMARHGASPALSPPSAHAPPEAPVHLVYARDWGWLRFGFRPGGQGCLVEIVLDATGG